MKIQVLVKFFIKYKEFLRNTTIVLLKFYSTSVNPLGILMKMDFTMQIKRQVIMAKKTAKVVMFLQKHITKEQNFSLKPYKTIKNA